MLPVMSAGGPLALVSSKMCIVHVPCTKEGAAVTVCTGGKIGVIGAGGGVVCDVEEEEEVKTFDELV